MLTASSLIYDELVDRCRQLSVSAVALAEVLRSLDARALPPLVQARALTALADVQSRLAGVGDWLGGSVDPQGEVAPGALNCH